MQKFISWAIIIVVAVVLGLSVDYAMADWTAAPSNPPSGNVPAPLNIGSSYQAKLGGLTLGAASATSSAILDAEGVGYIRGLIVGSGYGAAFQYLDGNQGAGKVLTSDASGTATWQTPASGGVSKITAGSNITVSPTGGTGNVTVSGSPSIACVKDGSTFSGGMNMITDGDGNDFRFICTSGIVTKMCYSTGGYGPGTDGGTSC